MEPTAADPVADPEDDPDADPVSADATGATIVVNGIAIAQAIKVFAAAFFTSCLSPKSIQGPRTRAHLCAHLSDCAPFDTRVSTTRVPQKLLNSRSIYHDLSKLLDN